MHVHQDRKSTRLNSSHLVISYAVFCLKKKKETENTQVPTSSIRQTDDTRSPTAPTPKKLSSGQFGADTKVNLTLALIIFFFFNDTATTEIYTLSLHDALPI